MSEINAAVQVLRDVLTAVAAGDPDAHRCALVAADAARGVAPALTVAEVAAMWRVAPLTVRRAIRRGDLDAIRVGRVIRVPASALAQYAQRAVRGNALPALPGPIHPVQDDKAEDSDRNDNDDDPRW